MDFDFNLILVPLTLVFILTLLMDKFVLKRFAEKKRLEQQLETAKNTVKEKELALTKVKEQFVFTEQNDVIQGSTPVEVVQAQDQLSQAQAGLAQASYQVQQHHTPFLISWAYDFWWILLAVLVVRSFIVEPFNIPSESMNPTLKTGDFILVNKNAYGVRLPLLNSKIIDSGSPKHGDVAVFRYPENPKIKFIKRIVGLPNDKIRIVGDKVYINGQLQASQAAATVNLSVPYNPEQNIDVLARQYTSKLGEHQFSAQYILPQQQNANAIQMVGEGQGLSLNQTIEFTVPEGQYFVLGDNRDLSEDSRYWGFVPEDHLTGKAVYVWMHKEPGFKLPSFSRNGLIP